MTRPPCRFPAMPAVTVAVAIAGLWAGLLGGLLGGMGSAFASSQVYKWVDAAGITHLSSEKPPAGTKYERVAFATSTKPSASPRSGTANGTVARVSAATPEQTARRNEIVTSLRNRECVVALEAVDRIGKGGQAVDPVEFRRLQQTADQNCSKDPEVRGEQEEMAARLRVAKGDVCVDARNKLADMLEPGRRPTREQVKTQQEFIESYCTAPVR